MAIKPVTFQSIKNFRANLYALEIKSRFGDPNNANGYYLGYGNELSAVVESNIVKIKSGAFIVQGRMVEITADGEIVSIPIESGKVGYIVARIETYKSNGQNCTIIAKTGTALNDIVLVQEDTYSSQSDSDENKIYELPLYSFEMNSTIFNLQKVIEPINEVAKIAEVANSANDKSNSALANSGGGYTFIVDSDEKLRQWAENAIGNDYSRVLIKKGTWKCTKGVALSDCKTVQVIGEGGNLIKITPPNSGGVYAFSVSDDLPPKGFCIIGVNIEIIDAEENYSNIGFENCYNMFNCSAYINGRYSIGFLDCINIINCSSVAVAGYANAYGFKECKKLLYCLGSGYSSRGSGYGFSNCSGVSYCSKNGTSKHSTFDTSTCCANLSDYNSTYAVANTANGGFNDIS